MAESRGSEKNSILLFMKGSLRTMFTMGSEDSFTPTEITTSATGTRERGLEGASSLMFLERYTVGCG